MQKISREHNRKLNDEKAALTRRLRILDGQRSSATGADKADLEAEVEEIKERLTEILSQQSSRQYKTVSSLIELAEFSGEVVASSHTDDPNANAFLKLFLTALAGYYKRDIPLNSIIPEYKKHMGRVKEFGRRNKIDKKAFSEFLSTMEAIKSLPRNNSKALDKLSPALDAIHEELYSCIKDIRSDPSLSNNQIALFNLIHRFLGNDSVENEQAIDAKLGFLKDSTINKWYETKRDRGQYDEDVAELKYLVSKMTGRKNDHALTREDAENLDPKRKKQLARYRQVRKKVLEHYKALVRQLVRENNGKPITITRLLKELDKSNIEVHSVPDGFEGKIDEQGRLYTHDEKRLNNPPTPGSKIEMNPNYDESVSGQGWYAKFWPPGAEKPQQSYTVDWKHKKTEVRDAQVDHLTDKVTSARKRWIADLNDDDKEVWSKGLMLELLYTYAMRIGTPGNQTDGEKTFGLTTLLAKHVTFQSGGKARIAFKGKSGVKQAYLIRPMDKISRLVIQRLQELVKGKQPSDHLFRVGTRNLTPADANIYIRKKGLNVTAKAFRRLKGKILMEGYLATKKIKKDATQKEAEDYLKRGALEVGKALGHKRGESEEFTPATALKSYIPPHIMLKFFADRGLRVPKWLQQHEKE